MTKGLLETVVTSPDSEDKSPFVTPVEHRKFQNAWSEIFLKKFKELCRLQQPMRSTLNQLFSGMNWKWRTVLDFSRAGVPDGNHLGIKNQG